MRRSHGELVSDCEEINSIFGFERICADAVLLGVMRSAKAYRMPI